MDLLNEPDVASVVGAAVEKHGATRDALIPILTEVNRVFGYIPEQAMAEIRRVVHSPEDGLFLADSHLFSITSFYELLSTQPVGRHVIRFCESAPCHVEGRPAGDQGHPKRIKPEPLERPVQIRNGRS